MKAFLTFLLLFPYSLFCAFTVNNTSQSFSNSFAGPLSRVVANPSGKAIALWLNNRLTTNFQPNQGNQGLFFNYFDPANGTFGAWSASLPLRPAGTLRNPIVATDVSFFPFNPNTGVAALSLQYDVGVDGSGNAIAIYINNSGLSVNPIQDTVNNVTGDVNIARFDWVTKQWLNFKQLTISSQLIAPSNTIPRIAVNSAGDAIATWVVTNNNNPTIVVYVAPSGGDFKQLVLESPSQASSGFGAFPVLSDRQAVNSTTSICKGSVTWQNPIVNNGQIVSELITFTFN